LRRREWAGYFILDRALWCFVIVISTGVLGTGLNSNAGASSVKARVHRSKDVYPVTGFGGYIVKDTVKSISAQWRVAKPGSTLGTAATWIGAQNGDGTAFIQLGIEEESDETATFYYPFWSDITVGFQPQFFGPVHSGQKIFVSMVRDPRGWLLTVKDSAASMLVKKQINYGAHATYNYAEWELEDPAQGTVAPEDIPFPANATATFQHLRVDGRAPHLTRKNGQTLSANGGAIEVPTPVRDDSFTYIRPTGAAQKYLEDARIIDFAEDKFSAEFPVWSTYSGRTRLRYVGKLVDAFHEGARDFRSQKWPAPSRRDVALLVTQLGNDAVNVQRWSSHGYKSTNNTFAPLESWSVRDDRLVIQLRATLELPPP
jgi:hypothetical protein